MKENKAYIVDCRLSHTLEADFYALNIWGKPIYQYVCETVLSVSGGTKYLLTDSKKIASGVSSQPIKVIENIEDAPESTKVIISGTAIFLKGKTIEDFHASFAQYEDIAYDDTLHPVMQKNLSKAICMIGENPGCDKVCIASNEAMVIDNKNAFELAIVLKKKELNAPLLLKMIKDRIEEKHDVITQSNDANTLCMIGHSQIDNWEIKELAGYFVQNCGIRGISSFEYNDFILKQGLIQCHADKYLVMHATNDIVTSLTDEEIMDSIQNTFDYIRERKPKARIYFLLCAHTNGRMDRSNRRIITLNKKMETRFSHDITCISLDGLNDEFGDLCSTYTIDGLHFSEEGYGQIQKIVESYL